MSTVETEHEATKSLTREMLAFRFFDNWIVVRGAYCRNLVEGSDWLFDFGGSRASSKVEAFRFPAWSWQNDIGRRLQRYDFSRVRQLKS